jgi:hypothetical protein
VIVLAGATGTGTILVQIMTETGLQRTLPHDMFGRAYGLAIPVSIGGIGAGSLIASALASTVGLTGALLAPRRTRPRASRLGRHRSASDRHPLGEGGPKPTISGQG